MRKQNIRKVKWDRQRARAYVLRDGVRYWAPQETMVSGGEQVAVFNPDAKAVTVKYFGFVETWRADATSPGEGG